jgi:hypothetical protein
MYRRRRDIQQGIRSLPVISVVYQVRVGNLNRLHTYIPPKSRGKIKWQDSRSSVFAWIKLQIKASEQDMKKYCEISSHFAELTACKDNPGGHYVIAAD